MNPRNVLIALVAAGLGFAFGCLKSEHEGTVSAQGAERAQVAVDDTKTVAVYANFCRVTGTPEEMILDYGLNPQPFGAPTQPIVVNPRIVMNFYSAKRMLHAIQLTIDRHEATFGTLETDVQKRVKTGVAVPRVSEP
ncbi:MAG: DUF3467 domain-containing protein [Thermoguttaceae bacterium]|jgi:hypothetical protein